MSLALIGGTGLSPLESVAWSTRLVQTRWGEVKLLEGEWQGRELVFLPRHALGHRLPPHRINYRANIAALAMVGVESILATSAVGTLCPELPPGRLALLTDFIDLTQGRPATYFDDFVVHLDSTEPFCAGMRELLSSSATTLSLALRARGVYACTNGPRFETPAEIHALETMGAEVVGMTAVPEVVLAREAEMCYASLAIATNWAAGMADQRLTQDEVTEMMAIRHAEIEQLIGEFVANWHAIDCPCHNALSAHPQAAELRAWIRGD
ncbi:MAG TPA: S-methyl-5'-thioinosine phosphorylase [Armatimonadetes bacterium]|nr:S-methyl-5'-thioinosine phosphorylase [Armatimonadota bacterium]